MGQTQQVVCRWAGRLIRMPNPVAHASRLCNRADASELDAILDSSGSALASARSNKLAFELCQASENGEHKTTMCRRCVGPRVVK
jgi:hypothetical protein